jgi:uncharacterized protein (TIGR04222 family)
MQLFSSWTGSDFLLFYTALLGFSTFAAWWIPAQLRAQGRRGESPDAEDAAVLVGGSAAHTDSVIADLFARGGLKVFDKSRLEVVQATLPASPAGRALLSTQLPFTRKEADTKLAIHTSRIAARLRREGLLLGPEELNQLRLLALLPFGILFLIGLYRQRAGAAEGEATGFLIALMVLTIVLAVIRFAKFDTRTAAGIAVVEQLRDRNVRLRRAPQAGEAGMAVALFGTGVLVGTPWEPVHALRQRDGSGDGGGDSGGDGGSGCGGGGCGGCGG